MGQTADGVAQPMMGASSDQDAGPPAVASSPPPLDFKADVAALWAVFDDGRTRSLQWRREQLDGIAEFLRRCEEEIFVAVQQDLGKPRLEAYASDVGGVRNELKLLRKHLPRLIRPRKLRTPLLSQPSKSFIYPEPWGTVLVLPTWNYPVALALLPLLGAVAAGNTVALKPSEFTPASSAVLAQLPRFVDTDAIRVYEGGPDTAEELLRYRFGHVHYTGSARVGRLVMAAAAAHLTPVTLELGGKNPTYVHRDANVAVTARRIMFGRLFNAGQTCVAPDYVLVDKAIEAELLAAMVAFVRKAYGAQPLDSPDLARIVNPHHFRRLMRLLKDAGEVVVGGDYDLDELFIAPTILRDVSMDHPIMTEEIFGPILPVIAVDGPEEAIARINGLPQPLTMYVFSGAKKVSERLITATSSGSVVVNQMFSQAANAALPFGGVGESGMGTYTGLDSFRCFTHSKAVAKSPFRPDPPVLYPPYAPWQERLLRRVLD